MASTTGASTNTPMWRSPGARSARTANATTATSTTAVANSYMLPHGSRSVARPRVTSTPAWARTPSPVRTMATRPHRRPAADSRAAADSRPADSRAAADSGAAGTPAGAPAATSSREWTGRRPNASCAQNATTATEYSATLVEKSESDRADSDSGCTRGGLRSGVGCRSTLGEGGPQLVAQRSEPRAGVAAAPRQQGQRQNGTAAFGRGRDPGEEPLPAQQ